MKIFNSDLSSAVNVMFNNYEKILFLLQKYISFSVRVSSGSLSSSEFSLNDYFICNSYSLLCAEIIIGQIRRSFV